MPKNKQLTVRLEPAAQALIDEVLDLHAQRTGIRASRAAVIREAFKRGLNDLKLTMAPQPEREPEREPDLKPLDLGDRVLCAGFPGQWTIHSLFAARRKARIECISLTGPTPQGLRVGDLRDVPLADLTRCV